MNAASLWYGMPVELRKCGRLWHLRLVIAPIFSAQAGPPIRFMSMTVNDPDALLAAARGDVLAWVGVRQPGDYASNEALADAFCRLLQPDTDLELRTVRNPSSF